MHKVSTTPVSRKYFRFNRSFHCVGAIKAIGATAVALSTLVSIFVIRFWIFTQIPGAPCR